MNDYLRLFSLEGKNAIVTGGSRGLGYGIAKALCQAGAKVVIIGSSNKTLESAKVLSSLSSQKVYGVRGDLSKKDYIPLIYEDALNLLEGKLDILVNCAGIQYRCKAIDFPIEEWERIIQLNLSTMFQMSQCAAKTMMLAGGGKIINIASVTSFSGSDMISAYSASKGGVAQLTKALSNEWAASNIKVNAIAPGYMITDLTSDMKEKNPVHYEEICKRIPMHRWGEPVDLEGISIFLASAASDYVSGAIIPVDGGYLGK